ncbi:hypothetical protein JZ751_010820 [Albula glossodonta]|uniref:H15 domain-containing protein n=1 Tax=Albula glossodonta TaxID=121402 RepID=A0A8T2N0D0_9TELE|nr:hypothetical protein JZ751_010820 [Albula glossodonta]
MKVLTCVFLIVYGLNIRCYFITKHIMPPKKAASIEVTSPEKPSSDAPKKGEKPSERANMGSAEPEKAAAPRKMPSHPSTIDMVKEALKELDTRKGSSAQAIRGYILEKYPSVDAVRLKYMLRKALAKGLEGGTLMRPANSTGNGAQGRFRLAVRSKAKEQKAKGTENADPNAEKPSPKKTKTKAKTKTKSKGPQAHIAPTGGSTLKSGSC